MKIDKALTVLKTLALGEEVELEGRTFVWVEDPIGDDTIIGIVGLAVKGKRYNPGEDWNDPNAGETVYMGADMPLTNFVRICENLSEDAIQKLRKE